MLRKLIHSYAKMIFRTLEVLFPPLAKKLAVYLFFTPAKFKGNQNNKWMESAKIEKVSFPQKNNGNSYFVKYEWGRGPVVLLIHGWAGFASQLSIIAKQLVEAGYKVISFDALAHGRSTGRQTNMLEFYKIVKHLQNEYGGFEAIAGHSLGGMAAIYSVKHQVRAKKIITIGAPSSMDFILDMFLMQSNFSRKFRKALIDEIKSRTGIVSDDITPESLVSEFNIAGLIIHDKDDKEIPSEESMAIAEHWPAAKLFLSEGLGHKRILADKIIIDEIVDFIKEKEIVETVKIMEQY